MSVQPPPSFLATPGEPKYPWIHWRKIFENYIIASGASDYADGRKKAILLHCLGPEGQTIFYTLHPADDTYKAAMDTLENHFMPAVNVTAERHRFRLRSQLPGENIDQYICALRDLISRCDYGVLADDMIRDQLIERTVEPRIRERLLLEPELTLETALTLAKQVESAIKESQCMNNATSSVNAVQKFTQKQSYGNNSRPKQYRKQGHTRSQQQNTRPPCVCYRCGNPKHKANYPQCPALHHTCERCSKRGHFPSECKSASRTPKGPTVNSLDDTSELTVLHVTLPLPPGVKKLTCSLTIGSSLQTVQIDTGSPVSILNYDTYRTICPTVPLTSPTTNLHTYDKTPIQVKGILTTKVTFHDRSTNGTFYVVEKGESLIGLDLISALRMTIRPVSNSPPTTAENEHDPSTVNRILTFEMAKQEFPSVFNGLGKATKFQHRSILKDEDVIPVAHKPRPVPFSMMSELRTEIDNMLADGIIEKVDHAEWVSPLVLTRRKSGKLRVCVDLRSVNKNIVPVKYPLPNIETLLSSIHKPAFITKLDMNSAYHQLPLHPETAKLCTFTTPFGLYRYTRSPFGLADLPGSFQKMMDIVLSGCEDTFWFLDDIVSTGENEIEHDSNVREVLTRFEKNGLTLHPDKCEFKQTSLEWLGFTVSENGIQMSTVNSDAITQLLPPENVKEVQSALGLFNHYAKFIPNFAERSEPLRKLVRGDTTWTWSDEEEKAFEDLKHCLIHSPVLALFQPSLPIVVTCDASDYALGAELSQLQDNGELRPVAFASKILTDCERRYSTGEKEALACVWSVKKWDRYLRGTHFKLLTDHQALVTLLQSPDTSGKKPARITRWASALLDYNFTMEYKRGSSNTVADALSRLRTRLQPNPDRSVDSISIDEDVFAIQLCSPTTITPEKLSTETQNDNTLKVVLDYLRNGWPKKSTIAADVLPYFHLRTELFIFGENCIGRGNQAVIPLSLRKDILTLSHDGHMGIVKTKQRLRNCAYWPGADKDIEHFVNRCIPCASSDKSAKHMTAPLSPRNPPKGPWDELGLDIQGPFNSAPHGMRYLINLIDYHSKWPESCMTENLTSANVIEFLASRFAIWGIPRSVTTDNGPQFVSHAFVSFLNQHDIHHIRTPNYHPMANGSVERLNGTIKHLLQTNVRDGKTWQTALRDVLHVIRSTPHASTSYTPFFLMTGREMRTKLTNVKPKLDTLEKTSSSDKMQYKANKMKAVYDKAHRVQSHNFKVGDAVRIRLELKYGKHKLSSNYSDPTVITNVTGNIVTVSNGKRWHVNRLVKWSNDVNEPRETNSSHLFMTNNAHDAVPQAQTQNVQGPRRSQRIVRPPRYLSDYVR